MPKLREEFDQLQCSINFASVENCSRVWLTCDFYFLN